MKKFYNLIKFISVILIFTVLFNFMEYAAYPRDISYDTALNFKNIKKNSLNMVILGNSHVFNGFVPEVIMHKLGVNAYDYATSGAPLEYSYFELKEILKRQKPKVVILELFTLADLEDINNVETEKANLHKAVDLLPLSKNKIDAIQYNASKFSKKEFYLPILLYHLEWKEGSVLEKISNRIKLDYFKNFTGYNYNVKMLEKNNGEILEESKTETNDYSFLPEKREKMLVNIVDLCKENNIKLIFVATPYINQINFPTVELEKEINGLKKSGIINNDNFIDFNKLYNELGISKRDLQDEGHCNVFGAVKISNYLAVYLDKSNIFKNVKISDEDLKRNERLYNDFMSKYYEDVNKNANKVN